METELRFARKPRSWPPAEGGSEDQLREALRRLEDVTRVVTDWVFETDSEGRLTFVSERVFEALYRLPAELRGKRFAEFGEFVDGEVEPDGGIARRAFRDRPFLTRARDGEERICLISAVPVYDDRSGLFRGVCGTVRDITEERRAEAGVRRLVTAVEELTDALALWDADDRLVVANARFRAMYAPVGDVLDAGVGYQALIRAAIDAGLYPQAGPDELDALQVDHGSVTERRFEIHFGPSSVLLIRERRLEDGGVVTVATDITESREAQRQLEKTAEKHKQFASDVAHELRTPLAVFRSNLDNLGDYPGAGDLRSEVDAMARMVEQMLTATRADFLSIDDAAEFDLGRAAVQVATALGAIAIKQGRPVEVDAPDTPVMVQGDGGAIEQALRNLVENALKYGAEQSIITIKVDPDNRIHVIDRGPGVAPEQRERIFERFVRADRKGSGAGLGLSIVRRIAEAHGATVSVGETPGGGATFSINFKV